METIVTPSGRLKESYLPAIYFDSSVLIDYWMTEGMEPPEETSATERDREGYLDHPLGKTIRDLVRSNSRLTKVAEIRQRVLFGDIKACPVTSHAALWELQEWIAESAFKQVGAEALGMVLLQRKSKKEIGDYLKRAFERWKAEGEEHHHDLQTGTSGLHMLMQETWINLSFAHVHGLQGISIADTVAFSWPPERADDGARFADPYMLAYLQVGMADIVHTLVASHLGCRYFASFDSDFSRAKHFIEDTGMSVLGSPEAVLSIL